MFIPVTYWPQRTPNYSFPLHGHSVLIVLLSRNCLDPPGKLTDFTTDHLCNEIWRVPLQKNLWPYWSDTELLPSKSKDKTREFWSRHQAAYLYLQCQLKHTSTREANSHACACFSLLEYQQRNHNYTGRTRNNNYCLYWLYYPLSNRHNYITLIS